MASITLSNVEGQETNKKTEIESNIVDEVISMIKDTEIDDSES